MATIEPKITPASVDEDLKKTIEKLDTEIAEDNPTPPASDPEPETPPADNDESETEEEPTEDTDEEEPAAPESKETKPAETQEETDFRNLYNQSSKEALALAAKNKKYEQISEILAPPEEELKAEYPDWDELSETNKKIALDNMWNNKRFAVINEINIQSKDADKWEKQVGDFVTDPKVLAANPELEGKTEEFKTFATKPTRRGVDMEDLVLAFLGDFAKNKAAPKKGKMFETGSAGGAARNPKPKDNKISLEDAKKLMDTNYKEYKRQLMAGNIASE